MKRTLFTIAAVCCLAMASNAQEKKAEPRPGNAGQADVVAPADPKAVDKVQEPQKPKDGTRMAITEKGIPASKNKEVKDVRPAAPEKAAPAPAAAPKH